MPGCSSPPQPRRRDAFDSIGLVSQCFSCCLFLDWFHIQVTGVICSHIHHISHTVLSQSVCHPHGHHFVRVCVRNAPPCSTFGPSRRLFWPWNILTHFSSETICFPCRPRACCGCWVASWSLPQSVFSGVPHDFLRGPDSVQICSITCFEFWTTCYCWCMMMRCFLEVFGSQW